MLALWAGAGVAQDSLMLSGESKTRGILSQQYPEVLIFNTAQQNISFALRLEGYDWQIYEIAAAGDQLFGCRYCPKGDFEVKISTDGREAHYRLSPGERYRIRWDPQERMWTLRTVSAN